MLRTMHLRDKREQELDSIKVAIDSNELKKENLKKYFEERLETYQQFKKDKKIEGIKY